MGRTVSVELTADVASYVSEVLEADKATDKLDKKVEALGHDLDKLPAESAAAAAGLAGLDEAAKKAGTDVEQLGKKTEEAGKKTSTSADESGKLKARIEELKGSVSKLGAEFDRTGDPALLKKFRADSSELAGLTKMSKAMEQFGSEVGKVGKEAEKAESQLSGLFEMPGLGQVGLGVAAAFAVPAIAGAGGALTAGAGIGAVGAGVAGAVAGDPQRFKAEWDTQINAVKKDWIDASLAFTGPTIDAIRTIGPMVDSWHLDETFQKASTFVGPLVAGVEGFITNVEGGVAKLVDNAGPVITTLEATLPQFGAMIADGLGAVADNAKGGAQALGDIIQLAGGVADAILQAVGAAEALYGGFKSADAAVANFIRDNQAGMSNVTFGLSDLALKVSDAFNADEVEHFGKALDGVTQSAGMAGDQAKTTADDFKALQEGIKADGNTLDKFVGTQVAGALNTMMSLDRATLGFDASLLQIADTFKKNGKSLDEMTAKGNANVSAVLNGVQANIQQYQANIAAKMGAEQAAAAYDANTAALERQLRKAGLTQAAIDGLIGKYKNVPDKVNTDIVLNGLAKAIEDLNTTLRLINGIHDKNVTISVATIYSSKGHPNVGQGGTVPNAPGGAFAEGGDPQPGWALVGETGPELVKFAGGEHVYTAAQTRSMMASSGSWGGGSGSTTVQVSLAAASGADTAVGTMLNKMIRDGLVVVKASQVRQGA